MSSKIWHSALFYRHDADSRFHRNVVKSFTRIDDVISPQNIEIFTSFISVRSLMRDFKFHMHIPQKMNSFFLSLTFELIVSPPVPRVSLLRTIANAA
jgi:hypothetical protein